MVFDKGSLQHQIARVRIIGQQSLKGMLGPLVTASCSIPLFVEMLGDFVSTPAVDVEGVNQLNKLSFILQRCIDTVHDAIPQHRAVPGQPLFEVCPDAPFLVLAGRSAFLLGVGCQDGHHQLAVTTHGVDVLLLKINVHPQRFEFTDGFQKCNRVSRKAGDGLGDHHIDFTSMTVSNQPLEVLSGILCAGLGLVGIDTDVEPILVALNQTAVVADLCRQRVEHGILAAGHTGIGCNTLFLG